MMSGMYAAISGLDAHQTMLDVTANNLANVDTIGYKAQSAQFSDELSQLIQAGTSANGYSAGTNPLQVGLGVAGRLDRQRDDRRRRRVDRQRHRRGDPGQRLPARRQRQRARRRPPTFDATQYTRAGDLTFNASGYLTTQTGQYVLGYGAHPERHHRRLLAPNTAGGQPTTRSSCRPDRPT